LSRNLAPLTLFVRCALQVRHALLDSPDRCASHPSHPRSISDRVLRRRTAYGHNLLADWRDDVGGFLHLARHRGRIMGWLAAIAGLIDFLGSRFVRAQPPAWLHAIGNVTALVLATCNMLVHSRDAWTSVVPTDVTLSAIVVLILLFTGWMGWSMVYHYRVGVV